MSKRVKHILLFITICILFIFIICKGLQKSSKEFISERIISNDEIDEKSGDISGESNGKMKYDIIEYDDSIMFSSYNNSAILINFDEDGFFSGVEYIAFCDDKNVVGYLIEQYESQVGDGIINSVSGEDNFFIIKYELEYFSDFVGKTKEEVITVLTSNNFIIKGE